MKRILRSLRRVSFVNAIGRSLLRAFSKVSSRLDHVSIQRWPVSGTFPVHIVSRRFRFYSEADDAIASLLYYGQEWEEKELMVWERLCRLSNTIIDVGAYNGSYSLVAATANPKAAVLAFEPHPANASRMKKNLALNGITNVRIERKAVGSAAKTVGMTVPADERMTDMASLDEGFARTLHGDRCRTIEIQQTTLDDIVKRSKLRRLDALKVDIEYNELNFLRGGSRSLKKLSPVILCEVLSYQALKQLSPNLQDVVKPERVAKIDRLVSSYGYSKFSFGVDGLVKIRSLKELPEERNFLFAKCPKADEFISYSDSAALDKFLLRALTPSPSTKTRKRL